MSNPTRAQRHHKSIQLQFSEFHTKNPEVYDRLVELSFMLKRRGITRWGIGNLWEIIRWESVIEWDRTEEFKLNNNYRSRYARMIMDREPALDGFFETRELQSA